MLIDSAELNDGAQIDADAIIAGGGMAGITIARELADAGHEVAIIESGGLAPTPRLQGLYEGKMTLSAPGNESKNLDDYLAASRVRCFGGSGNRWGGKCAPLDPIDFEKRDWIPHSGWPLTREQMQPYYDRACRTLNLPTFGAAPESVLERPDSLFNGRSPAFTLRPRRYSRATGVIGEAYDAFKRAASEHPRVRVYLNANVTRVQLARDGRSVERLDLRELSGRRRIARARIYVLALGGVENVRLMLVSNDVHRDGIGNHSDWLGRAFQGHVVISREDCSSLHLHRGDADLAIFNNANPDGPHAVIGASDSAQRAQRQVNFTATMIPEREKTPASMEAVAGLAKRLSGSSVRAQRGVYFMIEHTPNRDSRITLAPSERDELGMPRVRLDLRFNALELESFERSVRGLACELGRLDIGRVQWSGGKEQLVQFMASPSRHHMGATRMAVGMSEGVVDPDCRVHGVGNLYVAGSSVFPTSGIANPTLTLLALAHRMSDRVEAELKA